MNGYRTISDRWHQRSRIRNGRPILDTAGLGPPVEGHFFSHALLPLLTHPLIQKQNNSLEKSIEARHLYRHLSFTKRLELSTVNPVAEAIAQKRSHFAFSDTLKLKCFQVYCDEAYHGLMAEELFQWAQEKSGVPTQAETDPLCLRTLRAAIQEQTSARMREAVQILFVVISETLISTILTTLPRDPLVHEQVRRFIQEHALDEQTHFSVFAEVCQELWPQLGDEEQRAVGPLLPRFIRDFLCLDETPLRSELLEYGLSEVQAESILDEMRSRPELSAEIRSSAKLTLKLFERCGVLSTPGVRSAFVSAHLLENEAYVRN